MVILKILSGIIFFLLDSRLIITCSSSHFFQITTKTLLLQLKKPNYHYLQLERCFLLHRLLQLLLLRCPLHNPRTRVKMKSYLGRISEVRWMTAKYINSIWTSTSWTLKVEWSPVLQRNIYKSMVYLRYYCNRVTPRNWFSINLTKKFSFQIKTRFMSQRHTETERFIRKFST